MGITKGQRRYLGVRSAGWPSIDPDAGFRAVFCFKVGNREPCTYVVSVGNHAIKRIRVVQIKPVYTSSDEQRNHLFILNAGKQGLRCLLGQGQRVGLLAGSCLCGKASERRGLQQILYYS